MRTIAKKKANNQPISRFSDALYEVIQRAFHLAKVGKSMLVEPKHVFVAILYNKESLAHILLEKFGIDTLQTLRRIVGQEPNLGFNRPMRMSKIELHPQTQELLFEAVKIARDGGGYYVGTEHVLLALLTGKTKDLSFVKELLVHISSVPNFAAEVFRSVALPFEILRQTEEVALPTAKPIQSMPLETGEAAISIFTENLTNKYRQFDPIVARDQRKEITDQILTILMRSRNRNVMLVGASGIGKSHIVDEFSYRLVNGDVPVSMTQRRLLRMNIPAMISASKFPNEIEKQIMAVMNDAYGSDEIILFIDDIFTLLAPPMRGGFNMGSIFKVFWEKSKMNMIVTITPEDLHYLQENNSGILRFFSIIEVEEPSVEGAKNLLKDIVKQIEREHNVNIQPGAIEAVIRMASQYIPERVLPEIAIEVLDLAASKKKFAQEYKYKGLGELQKTKKELQERKDRLVSLGDYAQAELVNQELQEKSKVIKELQNKHKKDLQTTKIMISEEDVREIVSMWTKLPISTVSADETSMLLQLDKKIKESIISQEAAIKQVANAVKRGRVGISSKKRPWTSLLFLGPTGVGKTELAKVLAKAVFGDNEDRLIQIDMSEYMEQHSVSKLIGSPPGYVGYEQGGWLTEKITANPYSVVLFDEIEKAHPDVLNILLQILEDGHLMDAKGNRVSFQNTIIILTSNIGAEQIAEDKVLGFYREQKQRNLVELSTDAYDEMREKLMKELRKKLRPELLNRIDDVIIFRGLTKFDAAKVLEILINELNVRLKDMNLAVNITEKAKKYILDKGFSTEYGARPLRRVLQHEVENLVADYVLENNILDSQKRLEMKVLEVDVKRKRLIIT